ncbi:hydroxyacid dehydrogenase [Alcaligenaceae bacterium]|nr:hydroxyacid dehydrogenase [Alcaligenaceae bacterium]
MPDTQKKQLVYFESWVDPCALDILGERADIQVNQLRYGGPAESNWEHMRAAMGYQSSSRVELREPWFADAALLERCPRLLAVCSTGAGYDMIDVDACTAAGVIVCNQGGSNRNAVAEHAIGLMLSVSKKIGAADRAMRSQPDVERFFYTGNDLQGKTVGLIGIGQIGSRTAELCNAFGMTVLAYDPFLDSQQVSARGARQVDLGDLLRVADFVSVHCPRTEATFDMFGAKEFALMKNTACFINTARGGIHNEAALYEALREQRIAGAGLDVFLDEPPPPDHPLLSLANVVATPHIAGISFEALHNMASYAAHQWIDIFDGRIPPRIMNPEAWPRYSERFREILGFAPQELVAN